MEFPWIVVSLVVLAVIVGLLVIFLKRSGGHMEVRVNKPLFFAGVAIALAAAAIEFAFRGLGTWPMVLGIIGIGCIATSGYRPFAQKKK